MNRMQNWRQILRSGVTVGIFVGFLPSVARTQDRLDEQVRIVEENGRQFRETRTTVRRPVAETRVEEQLVTTPVPEFVNHMRQVPVVVQVPVPGQQVVTQRAWWNPWRWGRPVSWVEPCTIWQPRLQYRWVASTSTTWNASTKSVPTTNRYLRFDTEELVSRVALAPGESTPDGPLGNSPPIAATAAESGSQSVPIASTARRNGVSRFESDPPKYPQRATILGSGVMR